MEGSQGVSPAWSKVYMERGALVMQSSPKLYPISLTGPNGCPTLSKGSYCESLRMIKSRMLPWNGQRSSFTSGYQLLFSCQIP